MESSGEIFPGHWKREREMEEEEEEDPDQPLSITSDTKRRKPENRANGEPMTSAEHSRHMNILTRLFPEQKRNVLELILKGCGGDVVQTIETVLPSHEESLARGHFFASLPRGLFPGPPPPNSYSAFSPPTIPQGIPLSPPEYHVAAKCATSQCPGCVFYPGTGPMPTILNQVKDPKRESLAALTPVRSEPNSIPIPSIPGVMPHLEDVRYTHNMRSATAALMTMSSVGRVPSGDRLLPKTDRSPSLHSPRGSPKSEAEEKR